MKSYVPDFQIQSVQTLDSALKVLSSPSERCRPIAGGTDLMVLFEAGKLPKGSYLDISKLKELKGIKQTNEYVQLGALTTYSEILESQVMHAEFKMLCEAARLTGAVAIQNRGTLGGNIVNASPAADSPPALLVYDTEIELTSLNGSRWVAYETFHKGYKQMDIKPGELLTQIRIKRNTKETHQYYHKVGTRKAQAISKVCMAALAQKKGDTVSKFRLAYGSVAAIPLRCFNTEKAIEGQKLSQTLINNAAQVLEKEITPIDDVRSNKEYRRIVAVNLFKDFAGQL